MVFFRRKRVQPHAEPTAQPAMLVLLRALPKLDGKGWSRQLAAVEPLRIAPRFSVTESGSELAGNVEFDSHVVRVTGAAAPTDAIGPALQAAGFKPERKAEIAGHAAHLLLSHDSGGRDGPERVIALYKLAAVMGGDELLGAVMEKAATCATASMVREFSSRELITRNRELLPLPLFCGFVRVRGDVDWFVTRGGQLYGTPDFAVSADGWKAADALMLLNKIFVYVVRARTVRAGHSMRLPEMVLRFEALPETHELAAFANGSHELLLIQR